MNRQQRRASKANGRAMMKQGWTPWEDITDRAIALFNARGKSQYAPRRFLQNSMYSVQIHLRKTAWGNVSLLMVRRNDEAPIRSWSDMQRIKNEIAGPERTAVEVYPSEENLIDDANMYHMWVLPPEMELPFGLHFPGDK
jgi:hypothetical protein